MSRSLLRRTGVVVVVGLLAGTNAFAQRGGGSRTVARGSVNQVGRNVNVNGNFNRNANVNANVNRNANVNPNVNRNVDVNRNVNWDRDVDVDHRYGGWGYGYGCCYHPAATAAAVTAAAVTTAAVVGSVAYSLPASCEAVSVNGFTYQRCGSTWYQPQFSGSSVTYVVVNPPR